MLSSQFGDFRLGFFQRFAAAVQQFIRVADRGDCFRLKPRRFSPSMLTPNGVAWLPGNYERRNVLRHAGAAANHNV